MDHSNFVSFSALGTVSVECRGPAALPPAEGREKGIAVTNYLYTWFPSKTLRRQLPGGFSIKMGCCVCSADGLRRFTPVSRYEVFFHQASLAGLAILTHVQRLGRERHHSYCLMKLIFNAVREMSAHFDREFHFARDLDVRLTGRESRDEWSLLPKDIGLDRNGKGQPWSIGQFIEHGRAAAIADGIARPTQRQSIQYGFFEAARLNPLRLRISNS